MPNKQRNAAMANNLLICPYKLNSHKVLLYDNQDRIRFILKSVGMITIGLKQMKQKTNLFILVVCCCSR